MLTPAERTELRRLERALAYSAARSDVEVHCITVGDWHERRYDPESAAAEHREVVATAIRYLDLRGLIERSPQGLVRVREEGARCA